VKVKGVLFNAFELHSILEKRHMSSSTSISFLTFIGQQITIYGGFIIMIAGVLGNLISIIIFLSLKTFRQSSCAFYLTIMLFVNIGQLLFALFSRILITGYGIDWTITSSFFCKFRSTATQFCALVSYTCLCLATLDQYFATCTHIRWQQWSNIKLAHRLIILSLIIIILFMIPYPIFTDLIILATGKISCSMTNIIMLQYRNYFVVLFMLGYIPDCITMIFGILAYRNVQQIAYRTVPLVRRELDKQLTTMVLVQVVINLFTNVPCVTMGVVLYVTSGLTNASALDTIQFVYAVTLVISYTYFAVSKI
jgi:hypothetical protein